MTRPVTLPRGQLLPRQVLLRLSIRRRRRRSRRKQRSRSSKGKTKERAMRSGFFFVLAASAAVLPAYCHNVVSKPDPPIVKTSDPDPSPPIPVVHYDGEGCIVAATASTTSSPVSITPASGSGLDVTFTMHVLR